MAKSRHFEGGKSLSRQGLGQVEQGRFPCSGVCEQIAPFKPGWVAHVFDGGRELNPN